MSSSSNVTASNSSSRSASSKIPPEEFENLDLKGQKTKKRISNQVPEQTSQNLQDREIDCSCCNSLGHAIRKANKFSGFLKCSLCCDSVEVKRKTLIAYLGSAATFAGSVTVSFIEESILLPATTIGERFLWGAISFVVLFFLAFPLFYLILFIPSLIYYLNKECRN